MEKKRERNRKWKKREKGTENGEKGRKEQKMEKGTVNGEKKEQKMEKKKDRRINVMGRRTRR